MGLSTAEKNRRKRERKKKEREEQRKQKEAEEAKKAAGGATGGANPTAEGDGKEDVDDIEIEYVVEPLAVPEAEEFEAVRRFQELAVAAVSDDETNHVEGEEGNRGDGDYDYDDEEYNEEDDSEPVSKRKLREILRPSVGELKRRVQRPDLVEAHDVTAADPEFLIAMKAVPGTVPVPRHWGRKRKYLQGKVRLLFPVL